MALSGHMLTRVYGLLLSLLGFYSFLTEGRIETVDLEAPELTCSEVSKRPLGLHDYDAPIYMCIRFKFDLDPNNLEKITC